MSTTVRSRNLDLIRWMQGGHNNAAKVLANVTNGNYLSQMANGQMEIGDYDARHIERILNLPTGWMDRDNYAMLHMSNTEFDIQQQLLRFPENVRTTILRLLKVLRVSDKADEQM